MAHNVKRTQNMRKKSDRELREIEKSGSLSSAAASYEINRRFKDRRRFGKESSDEWTTVLAEID